LYFQSMAFLHLLHRSFLVTVPFFILISCANKLRDMPEVQEQAYEENWESLSRVNEEPDWLKDAKFGIYFHWGVYSVPAFGNEWYPRMMHFKGLGTYEHHLAHYGHPTEFGYHDFVPLFRAEKFDPDAWADLFIKAGARFAGPVAEHHDGFAMWDSKATPWNSMDKGPGRDITGEMERAIRARGLKFITTFHHARQLQRYKGKEEEVITREKNIHYQFRLSHYPLFPGMPPSMDDPELNYLYGNIPEPIWLEELWFAKLKEVVDNYSPDLVYFDSWLNYIPDSMRLRFCTYYYNQAMEAGREVVIARKQHDLPLECSVDDLEKFRKNHLAEKLWITDETISKGSWCYTEDLQIRPAADILHILIDIVSKNGVLMLNISPKADGTIPENQQEVLLELGRWLDTYGEAVYGTRPWYTYGEGPTGEPERQNPGAYQHVDYMARDVRFTSSATHIYALFLGKPEEGAEILLTSFSAQNSGQDFQVVAVSLVGQGVSLAWELGPDGLRVRLPSGGLDPMSTVLKIETEK
jgi:alpha-L-fucosidase